MKKITLFLLIGIFLGVSAFADNCLACNGTGQKTCYQCRGSGTKVCYKCAGSGQIAIANPDFRLGNGTSPIIYKTCHICDGSGRGICETCYGMRKTPCSSCNGSGQMYEY